MDKAYFFAGGGGGSLWRDVPRDMKYFMGGPLEVWDRYLFQNDGRSLHVFRRRALAKYKTIDGVYTETPDYFLGWPEGHFRVFSSMAFFAPEVLVEQLGIKDPMTEKLNGTDSGPIGYYGSEFNGATQPEQPRQPSDKPL